MKFLDYIQGYRKGKMANEIEQKSLTDPFLYDAIDGYDTIDGDHLEHIAEMQTRIQNKHLPSKSNRILRILAAAVVFFAIFGSYLYLSNESNYNNLRAYLDISPEENTIENQVAVAEKVEDILQIEEKTEEYQATIDENAISDYRVAYTAPTIVEAETVQPEHSPEELSEKKEMVELSKNVITEDQIRDISADALVSTDFGVSNEKQSEISAVTTGFGVSKKKEQSNIFAQTKPNKTATSSYSVNKDTKDVVSTSKSKDKSTYFNEYKSSNNGSEEPNPNGDWFIGAGASSTAYFGPTDQHGPLDRISVVKEDASKGKISEKSIPIIGEKNYKEYLKKNIRYPKDGECSKIKGSVIVEFNLTKTGSPINIRVVKSLCPELDQEAIRLVRTGSNWTPSDTSVNLLINFEGNKKGE